MSAPSPHDIEAILQHHFPMKQLADLLATGLQTISNAKGEPSPPPPAGHAYPDAKRIEAMRQELLALSSVEVARLAAAARASRAAEHAAEEARQKAAAEAKRAAKEGERFYNLPSAIAEFAFWCKAEYWTPDEAAALLLGRDPRVVRPEALTAELNPPQGMFSPVKPPAPSEFHRQYDGLRALISRASNLQGVALTPHAALVWALRTKAVTVPPALVRALQQAPVETTNLEIPSIQPIELPQKDVGTPTRWTPEMLEQLRTFRDQHGAKAASEEFGISPARVRQLLPRPKPDKPKLGAFGTIVHRLR